MILGELQTEKEILEIFINNWNDNDETALPPLFHGTDSSLVDLSQAKRKQLNEACEIIIHDLLKLYKSNSISLTDKRLVDCRDSYGRSSHAYYYAQARANNSSRYSYGDFYVTNSPARAIYYSLEAWIFGETGWVANRLVEGSKALGLDLPNNGVFQQAYALFEMRKQRMKNPEVLIVVNGNATELYTEDGDSFKEFDQEELASEIHHLKNASSITDSYRLGIQLMDESSEIYRVNKDHYSELLKAWERRKEL